MADFTVIDKGFKKTMARFRGANGAKLEVGTIKPPSGGIPIYFYIWEGKVGYLRNSWDKLKKQIQAQTIQVQNDLVDGKTHEFALRDLGEQLVEAMKGVIVGRGLVKSGDLRDSIGFRIGRGSG